MLELTTQQIRSTFISKFKNYGHTHIPSSSLVPCNDPSLMFVNSGMVQFKNVFTGLETREYKRAVTNQKSIRISGKHNDLDNVGYTKRHHTFFEMLGNFSFGDYFKEEAIFYAWTLLTKDFFIPKEKLYVTVYHNDEESISYWKKISGISDDRIIRVNTSDNFWSMGDIGPCGPCSEIFYDQGENLHGGLPGSSKEEGDRFTEIWNLVFMQYAQINKDTRVLLDRKSVDTGMGLERLSSIIQGVDSNYDIDIFRSLIHYAESILKVPASGDELFSYRVIVDHLRSSSFLIIDGVLPSNEGRGYILRRIIRRAMVHAYQLGAKEPLMYRLLPKLKDTFGNVYTDLIHREQFIVSVIKQEEEKFKCTLDRGLKLLGNMISSISSNRVLSGALAFKLYDTYGFPIDLTKDILKKYKISVDYHNFIKHMNAQKERARKFWGGSGQSKIEPVWFNIFSKSGKTNFLGYNFESSESQVVSLIQNSKESQEISTIDTKFILVANQTPFYGESGGQIGDIGIIESASCKIEVVNTLKYIENIIGHICILKRGIISKGDKIKMLINSKYRNGLKIHHTATHILHATIRDIFGNHVVQKGSLIASNKLRFDFSYPSSLTDEELQLIEARVNKVIAYNSEITTKIKSRDEAVKSGAVALFNEKYSTNVRVVSLEACSKAFIPYSLELCGGTHVERSGDIGTFKIINEGASAAGVRRIEAVCGEYAVIKINENETLLKKIKNIFKCSNVELVEKVESVVKSKKKLEKSVQDLLVSSITPSEDDIERKSKKIYKARLINTYYSNFDIKTLCISAQNLIKRYDDLVVFYIIKNKDKIHIIIAVSKMVSTKYSARNMAKNISSLIGRNTKEEQDTTGGRNSYAQIGGVDISKLSDIKDYINSLI